VERHNETAANANAIAAVDAIEDEHGQGLAVVPNDRRIVVRGWALDAGARAFAAVEFDVGGARTSGPSALARPDVAAVYGSPDTVGFRLELALDDAAPGRHAVALHGRRADGSRVRIPVAASLDVVAPLGRLPAGVRAGTVVGAVDEVGLEGMDAGGGPLVVAPDGVVVVRGWAATPDGVPATLAYAELDGQLLVRGMSGYPRPDVAAHLGTQRAGYGFRIRVAASELARGEHTLRVRAVAGEEAGFVGDEARFTVGPPAAARVFQTKPRLRGHVDVIGRLDGATTLLEERMPLRLKAEERAIITGWAGDPIAKLVPNRVMLVVDGVAHGPVQRGIERADVVAATACERLRSSGFSAVVRAEGLGAGFHRAELIALYDAEPVVFDAFSFEVVT
jgi:hypothetical protein